MVGRFHRVLQGFRFSWREKTFTVGASLGLVPIHRDFKTVAHLLSAADHACYVAKEKGRNRIQVYQEDDAAFVRRQGEMNWVVRIQETLEQNRFCLFSQSIQPLSEQAARGIYFEVLLRMVEEDGRIHLPSDFIRAAERYGLMRNIDRWVIRECIRTLMTQPPPFLDLLHLCSINLSARLPGGRGVPGVPGGGDRVVGRTDEQDLLRDHRDRGDRELRPGREAARPPHRPRRALRPRRLRQPACPPTATSRTCR